jgi:hypothetical protein
MSERASSQSKKNVAMLPGDRRMAASMNRYLPFWKLCCGVIKSPVPRLRGKRQLCLFLLLQASVCVMVFA